MLVTDWQEVYNQLDWHQSASSGEEAVAQALLRSSTDMVCIHLHTLSIAAAA